MIFFFKGMIVKQGIKYKVPDWDVKLPKRDVEREIMSNFRVPPNRYREENVGGRATS